MLACVLWCLGCGSDRATEPAPAGESLSASPTSSVSTQAAQLVKVTGISMELPASFVPLEAPKQERLRAAAAAREPKSTVVVDARRAPTGMKAGTAYVLRLDLPEDPAALRGTVRDALEYAAAALRLEMLLQGATENLFEAKYENDRLDVLTRVTLGSGERRAVLEARAVVFMSKANRLVTLSAQCMADAPSFCEPLLRNAKIDDERRRGLSEVLGPPAETWTAIAGFEFGQSRADFAEACRAAKHQVDKFDWSKEPVDARRLVESGAISRCSGTPKPFEQGRVVAAGGYFEDNKLTSLSLYLEEETEVIRKRIFERYSDGIVDPAAGVAFFNLIATGYQPFLVRVDPVSLPGTDKVHSAAAFSSRIAFDKQPR